MASRSPSPIALVAGSAWRSAWLAFAVVSMLVTLWAARVLPTAGTRATPRELPRISRRWLVCPRSRPLLLGALLIGLGSSVYWTFAVDYLVTEGSLPTSTSRLFLVLVGSATVLGTLAGDLLRHFSPAGAFSALTAMLAGSLGLLAVAPASLGLAAFSGVLFGASFSLIVAIQSIWTSRVFAERPSAGLAAVMFMLGLGLLDRTARRRTARRPARAGRGAPARRRPRCHRRRSAAARAARAGRREDVLSTASRRCRRSSLVVVAGDRLAACPARQESVAS